MSETLRDRLIREEGLRLFPYKDSKGIWTIGVGHNMETDPIMSKHIEILKSRGITKEEAYALLDRDIKRATGDLLEALPWTGRLDWPRKSVLIDLCFNMGVGVPGGKHGLLTFKNTLEHMKRGEWTAAAEGLRNSKWYQDVEATRAEPLISILLTGEGVTG